MWRWILMLSLIASLITGGASAEAPQRLLVLPFDNSTGSHDFDGLAEGAAELLPVCLSNHTSELVVIGRADLDELLREKELGWEGLLGDQGGAGSLALLGANVLVRGSLSRSDEALLVSVFLHDVETTQLIASSTFQGPPTSALELLCDNVAAEIARNLTGDLAGPVNLPSDADPVRTQLLISGIGHYYNGNYAEAFPAFMKLLRRDEGDAEARFWLAQSFYSAGMAAYADHELRQFLTRFPNDRNYAQAKKLLNEIDSTNEN